VIRSAVVGASGYSGGELLRLLLPRDDVSVETIVAHSSVGKLVHEVHPHIPSLTDESFESLRFEELSGLDVVFLALPSGEAMTIVPNLIDKVARIIDLSGDFRLPVDLYERFYRRPHAAAELLDTAVYGLPELHREKITDAKLVANPGCYPTGGILALLPAVSTGIVETRGIVIDSMSGVTGAGRSASVEMSFAEVNENVRAYKVGVHQHIPEIEHTLSESANMRASVSFVPHLVPLNRGIYTTTHSRLVKKMTTDDIIELYSTFYQHEPFIRVKKGMPQIKEVAYTNFCDIGVVVEERTNQLISISVLDNLLKGAAGQAVQNMNIMFGCPDDRGLLTKEKLNV
jgi:N-acetyl-gamma-glutamyl-phosphate reductase